MSNFLTLRTMTHVKTLAAQWKGSEATGNRKFRQKVVVNAQREIDKKTEREIERQSVVGRH